VPVGHTIYPYALDQGRVSFAGRARAKASALQSVLRRASQRAVKTAVRSAERPAVLATEWRPPANGTATGGRGTDSIF